MVICVTNRTLCQEDFLQRMRKVAAAKPYAVMLREKDLDLPAYERLAWKVKEICDFHEVRLILQQYGAVAERVKPAYLHLSMPALRSRRAGGYAIAVGASVHSVAEAGEAAALGAAYLVAGHIYATDCKKGLPPRGVPFLRQVCQAVAIPVFAIGGIAANHVSEIMASGAAGFCVMSSAMTCPDPTELIESLRQAVG